MHAPFICTALHAACERAHMKETAQERKRLLPRERKRNERAIGCRVEEKRGWLLIISTV